FCLNFSETFRVVGPDGPVLAAVGSDVILPCFVKQTGDNTGMFAVDLKVSWTKSDTQVHLYQNKEDLTDRQSDSYKGRTTLDKTALRNGNASLKLTKVTDSDMGTYNCTVGPESGNSVSLEVQVIGTDPEITVKSLLCESKGWRPAPKLDWLDGNGAVMPAEVTERERSDYLVDVESRFKVDSGDSFLCRVTQDDTVKEETIEPYETCTAWMAAVGVVAVLFLLVLIVFIKILKVSRHPSLTTHLHTQELGNRRAPMGCSLHSSSPEGANGLLTVLFSTRGRQWAARCTLLHQRAPTGCLLFCSPPEGANGLLAALFFTRGRQRAANCSVLHQRAPMGCSLHSSPPEGANGLLTVLFSTRGHQGAARCTLLHQQAPTGCSTNCSPPEHIKRAARCAVLHQRAPMGCSPLFSPPEGANGLLATLFSNVLLKLVWTRRKGLGVNASDAREYRLADTTKLPISHPATLVNIGPSIPSQDPSPISDLCIATIGVNHRGRHLSSGADTSGYLRSSGTCTGVEHTESLSDTPAPPVGSPGLYRHIYSSSSATEELSGHFGGLQGPSVTPVEQLAQLVSPPKGHRLQVSRSPVPSQSDSAGLLPAWLCETASSAPPQTSPPPPPPPLNRTEPSRAEPSRSLSLSLTRSGHTNQSLSLPRGGRTQLHPGH
ncbi:hypothetical protein NFI96_026499, partial [Prochilodus magdalenae]